ncbi:MAG: thiamine pyrophosphate-dependent dehydrogenase E1 component subunit alpha [Chloroflexi bacterium]|nr:thiamine pyrophosphate-dependent dehydrogenase E1 component subunit alpha [Chloroflexota bacterium]
MTASPATALPPALGREGARRLYRLMLLTRLLDERLWIVCRQGKAHFVLTGRGHEAAQCASALALRPGQDWVYLYYRSLGSALTLGFTPNDIFLGVLGKAADPISGARQLPNHFSSRALRVPTTSSSVATQIPHAVGTAWAVRVQGEDVAVFCSFGEGATSKGEFHEALNVAGIHRLPVVFFCENNGWAISVPLGEQVAGGSVAARAAGYGMPGVLVDGLDPFAVYQTTAAALERARAGDGPTLIEATCLRLVPHSSDDSDRYRSEAEKAALQARDPLPAFRDRLLALGVLTPGEPEAWAEQLQRELIAAQDTAEAQPPPEPSRARRWLYAEDR